MVREWGFILFQAPFAFAFKPTFKKLYVAFADEGHILRLVRTYLS